MPDFKPPRPGGDPVRRAALARLLWTWVQTLLGTAIMGGLAASALAILGLSLTWSAAFFSIWMLIPVVGWYFSAQMVKRLTGCRAPDPHNPEHQRLTRIVDALYPKTGLAVKPPVFISPIRIPNAFATGRTPSQAFIAATEGLLDVGLTDDELEAVLAHELAHVRNYDVALNSTLAALASLFSLVLATGLPSLFAPAIMQQSHAPLLDKLDGRVRSEKKRFFLPDGGVLGFVTMLIIFYVVSAGAKLVSLFVTRVRESGADAHAAYWTGKPCALSMALQKIVLYTATHQADIRGSIITRGLTPLWFVSPFDDGRFPGGKGQTGGILKAIRRWWHELGENHPPVHKRLDDLDRLSGSSCPRAI